MIVKFNGGLGAILCSKCGKILYTFANMPKEISDRMSKTKDYSKLPDVYCEDNCEESYRILNSKTY